MIYIVSGMIRTGTSMMMNALNQGGLDAIYRESRNQYGVRHRHEGYDPNPDGLFELEGVDFGGDFPYKFNGKLIKVLDKQLKHISGVMKTGMRVVYMIRDKEEIESSIAMFNKSNKVKNIDKRWSKQAECIDWLLNRRDVWSLDVFCYQDVLSDSKKHFETLCDHGWKIDVNKAMAVVNPEYCHFKKGV